MASSTNLHAIFDADVLDVGLERLRPADFDALPFGTIRLDREGVVTLFNATEASLARRSSATTLGKKFFEEVAPCTNNAVFRGRLDELVRTGVKTAHFDYRFLFAWGERPVRIKLWVPDPDHRWIFVLPLDR